MSVDVDDLEELDGYEELDDLLARKKRRRRWHRASVHFGCAALTTVATVYVWMWFAPVGDPSSMAATLSYTIGWGECYAGLLAYFRFRGKIWQTMKSL